MNVALLTEECFWGEGLGTNARKLTSWVLIFYLGLQVIGYGVLENNIIRSEEEKPYIRSIKSHSNDVPEGFYGR
jgi:hypothetical protein